MKKKIINLIAMNPIWVMIIGVVIISGNIILLTTTPTYKKIKHIERHQLRKVTFVDIKGDTVTITGSNSFTIIKK